VIVDRVGGDEPARYGGSIGRRLPIHLGAGKVLAALLPTEELEDFLSGVEDYSLADGKIMTSELLREELLEVRAQGYSIAAQERIPGRFSVGAPVQTAPGVWDAAIVLSGRQKSSKFDEVQKMAQDVSEAAGELSAQYLRNS
ncbi:MAG: IclR family transcriptional regulator C-terminal domain-containing protein, partial [Microbacteriaceae bacterium]